MPDLIEEFNLSKDAPLRKGMQAADEAERLNTKNVWKGFLVYQVDNDKYYKCDVATRTNASAPFTIIADWTEDPFNVTGTAGTDGSTWFRGAADPNNGTGVDGDFYLQTAAGSSFIAGDIFQKAGGVWGSPFMNNVGADGLDATNGFYGGMFIDDNGAGSPQVIGTSLTKIGQFNADGVSNAGITVDNTLDRLTAVNAGIYIFTYNLSISGSAADFTVIPHVNGSPIIGFSCEGTIASTADKQIFEVTFPISLTAGQFVELFVKADADSKNFLVREGSFSLSSIGASGAKGDAGEDLSIDEGDVAFNEAKRIEIEAGTGSFNDRWVVTVINDTRSNAERTAGPTILQGLVTNKMIAWDGSTWFIYGTFRGSQGLTGTQGSTGSTGAKGNTGNTGAKGDDGSQGIQGIQGSQGIQGIQGPVGATGSAGNAVTVGQTFVNGGRGGALTFSPIVELEGTSNNNVLIEGFAMGRTHVSGGVIKMRVDHADASGAFANLTGWEVSVPTIVGNTSNLNQTPVSMWTLFNNVKKRVRITVQVNNASDHISQIIIKVTKITNLVT